MESKRTFRAWGLALLASAALFAGCGGGDSAPPATEEPEDSGADTSVDASKDTGTDASADGDAASPATASYCVIGSKLDFDF